MSVISALTDTEGLSCLFALFSLFVFMFMNLHGSGAKN